MRWAAASLARSLRKANTGAACRLRRRRSRPKAKSASQQRPPPAPITKPDRGRTTKWRHRMTSPAAKMTARRLTPCGEACIRSCGDGDPGNFDCDGVKAARAKGLPLCPDVSGGQPDTFATGWCTGHRVQRQRNQNAVGDRYVFIFAAYM